MAWLSKSHGLGKVLGASEQDEPVTNIYNVSYNGASNHVVEICVQDVEVGEGITAQLQTASSENGPWKASKSVPITENGSHYIKLLAVRESDQEYLPLMNKARIVISTGENSAVSVTNVIVIQDL